ncbi:hypothetical protein NH340_JMT07586 [Sarcoptes scabiei]|nr:hypothetical protein NH340_JMT07586 [Sarcoptes scabiei]
MHRVDVDEFLSRKQTIYAGFDATNQSLHVGNLLVLISLFHLAHHGHKIIVLIGDCTAKIGDPSGKLIERSVIDDETIELNAKGIENDVRQVWQNYLQSFARHRIDDRNLMICRNSDWYSKMNVIEFIGKYARQMRMGDLLSKSSIKERLESPIGLNFSEFSYQCFQAYDWYHLRKRFNCNIQIGGTDQMINIHNGYDLIKKIDEKFVCGLFVPLITDAKGNKLGKTDQKAYYLNSNLTTPFGLYQYCMRIVDSQINKIFKMFSFRSLSDIENIIQEQMRNPKPWRLQRYLAEELVQFVHGPIGLERAKAITKALFDKNLDTIGNLDLKSIRDIFDDVSEISIEFVQDQLTLLNLTMRCGFFVDEMQAIKTIKDGGIYLNYQRMTDPGQLIESNQILNNGISIISFGQCLKIKS